MVLMTRPIDPHTHLRWEEQHSDFLGLSLKHADAVGMIGIIEQPNTKPALTDKPTIESRFDYVDSKIVSDIGHGAYMGLTEDIDQVARAFKMAMDCGRIKGVKAFWTHSTGNMGLLDKNYQRKVWDVAADVGYTGVLFQHLEDEEMFSGDFDFQRPVSHSIRQNEGSELAQAVRQIRNATDAGFSGIFYAAHVSSSDTIDYLNNERKGKDFEIVIETTWHHMFLNWKDYEIHGTGVKMNPPLREAGRQKAILERVLDGKTDIIGSDSAPHDLSKKYGEKAASGIYSIPFIPKGVEFLLERGASHREVSYLTFGKANELFFGNCLPEIDQDVEYDPRLWDDYGHNPFSRIDGTL